MPDVLLGGMGGTELVQSLERILVDAAPAVIGIASAFVSVLGVELTKAVIDDAGIEGCRLVAGTDYAITHPEALTLAKDLGWCPNRKEQSRRFSSEAGRRGGWVSTERSYSQSHLRLHRIREPHQWRTTPERRVRNHCKW